MSLSRTQFGGLATVAPGLAASCSGAPIAGLGVTGGLDGATRALIQNVINTLDRQSSAWQATLTQRESDLTGKAQNLVLQVDALLQRGIASAGGEIRCDTDFIGARVKHGLEQIIAVFDHAPLAPLPPSICHAVPDHVDRRLDPSQLSIVAVQQGRRVLRRRMQSQ